VHWPFGQQRQDGGPHVTAPTVMATAGSAPPAAWSRAEPEAGTTRAESTAEARAETEAGTTRAESTAEARAETERAGVVVAQLLPELTSGLPSRLVQGAALLGRSDAGAETARVGRTLEEPAERSEVGVHGYLVSEVSGRETPIGFPMH
jgi:hypothetical protein